GALRSVFSLRSLDRIERGEFLNLQRRHRYGFHFIPSLPETLPRTWWLRSGQVVAMGGATWISWRTLRKEPDPPRSWTLATWLFALHVTAPCHGRESI